MHMKIQNGIGSQEINDNFIDIAHLYMEIPVEWNCRIVLITINEQKSETLSI